MDTHYSIRAFSIFFIGMVFGMCTKSLAQQTTYPQLVPPISDNSQTFISVHLFTFGVPLSLSIETIFDDRSLIRVGGIGFPIEETGDFNDRVSADRNDSPLSIYFTYGILNGDESSGVEFSAGVISYALSSENNQNLTVGLVTNLGMHFSGGKDENLKFQLSFSPIFANKAFYPRVGLGIGWKLKMDN